MGTLFPQLSGDTLITQLQAKFSPDRPAKGYGAARDQMFSGIDNVDGTVTGVYTGIQISLDANSAPPPRTQAFEQQFQTEHTWPQSKGADRSGPKSDLHHLFPTQATTNNERSNHPFGDIPDATTKRWDCQTGIFPSAPVNDRDLCSESDDNQFEPPEAHKGNVARAMFYFRTISGPGWSIF
jgi:hypothetical protein